MIDASQVKEHMEVVCKDGGHVGTVDHVDGNRIKLAKSDPAAGGQHHYLPLSVVQGMEGGKLKLSIGGQQARQMMTSGGTQTGQPQPGHQAGQAQNQSGQRNPGMG